MSKFIEKKVRQLLSFGFNAVEIQEMTGISRNTVTKYRKKFKEEYRNNKYIYK